ncbi:MAG: hypothetical protein KF715_03005 [Candidatus Didemnitutus sp.]|nr:hypothetical protein [Candidatus Didemnitutus sp.]
MKTIRLFLVLIPLAGALLLRGNTAPTPVINSAVMRAGTTLLDVNFRVNDPDDATVQVRALAFIDGVRSFAKVIKPVTFVEGTASKLGDAIATNTNHVLTWDVGAEWATDLGQLKFEILALDARGLLAFDWITIPAAGGHAALTISKDAPTSAKVLDALFWLYASGDPGLSLAGGILTGTAAAGNFSGLQLVNGATVQTYAAPYVFKKMNLDPATYMEVAYASGDARAGLLTTGGWHAANRAYAGISIVYAWGNNNSSQATVIPGLTTAIRTAASSHSLILMGDGTVVAWGSNSYGQATVPAGLTGVTAIAASGHSLALKSDGTVVAWGYNSNGQSTVPAGLSGVTAIAAGGTHSLALKNDGTVVAWGNNANGQTTVPTGLTGVTAIAASAYTSFALKSNGTVVAWGGNSQGEGVVPAGLSGVVAISSGNLHCLALKGDGTVVAWGWGYYGQTAVPAGLTGVIAIAAGSGHSVALKSDGTVVAWGYNDNGQSTIPSGVDRIAFIAAAGHNLFLRGRAP